MKTPEAILRRKAQELYRKEQELKHLNPFADGTLTPGHVVTQRRADLLHEIDTLRAALATTNEVLSTAYMTKGGHEERVHSATLNTASLFSYS